MLGRRVNKKGSEINIGKKPRIEKDLNCRPSTTSKGQSLCEESPGAQCRRTVGCYVADSSRNRILMTQKEGSLDHFHLGNTLYFYHNALFWNV